jgi:DNA-binding IclR family transcriptional regulator
VRDIVDEQGLVRQTENTLTDTDELFAELETIRERGYAVNDEEEIRGMRSVGVPIRGIDGDVCGAVSVTGPAARLTGERFESELPDLVMQTANLIEVNLETAAFDR